MGQTKNRFIIVFQGWVVNPPVRHIMLHLPSAAVAALFKDSHQPEPEKDQINSRRRDTKHLRAPLIVPDLWATVRYNYKV